MGLSVKLANVWRIVKDVDLEAIRKAVNARFELWILSEEGDDAARLRALLSPGGETSPHPWLIPLSERTPLPSVPPIVAVMILRRDDSTVGMSSRVLALREMNVPLIALVIGGEEGATAPRRTEAARLVAPALDSVAARAVAIKLAEVAGPEGRLALARQLDIVRSHVIDQLIEETARANATFAFTTGLAETLPVFSAPLALGDMVVLTKNQLLLSYRMALVSGREGDPKKLIGEIIGVLGGGVLFRQAARQLVGLVPVVGLLPKVAIAYAGTYAIGRAMNAWLSDGRQVTADVVKSFSTEGLTRGRDFAQTLAAGARQGSVRASRAWERLRHQIPLIGRSKSERVKRSG